MGRHRSSGPPGNYTVGYRKPPKASQFKPGNKAAKGRRKRPAKGNDFASELRNAFAEQVGIDTENGHRSLSLTKLIARQIARGIAKKPPTDPRKLSDLVTFIDGICAEPQAFNDFDHGAMLRKKIDDMADRLNQEAEREKENQLPESDEVKK
jgi:hypothetical protein